jgi:hypothetical protein
MIRNFVDFGTVSLAGRGGESLYIRAVVDQMTKDEYLGGLSIWAPYPLNGALRRIFGFSRSDTIRVGGRLQHISESPQTDFAAADYAAFIAGKPESTYTYFLRVYAEKVILQRQFEKAGVRDVELSVDREMMARAGRLIGAHPWKHVALTPLLLWRGAFFIFPMLGAVFVWSLRRRDLQTTLLLLPSLGMIAFYALLTLYIPRYSLPAAPLALCAAVAVCESLFDRFRSNSERANGRLSTERSIQSG